MPCGSVLAEIGQLRVEITNVTVRNPFAKGVSVRGVSEMKSYLNGLVAIGVLSMSIPAQADPILTTVSCDSTGLYTCLSSVENFQIGDELYNANFVPANILDAFDVDYAGKTLGEILEQLKPLDTAVFWDDRGGAQAFADALAALLSANDIDGFLCAGRCEFNSLGLPFGYTYIPVYLQTTTNVEVADCFVGRSPSTGQGVQYCGYNPGSNNQNWAVISRVPEPATIALVALGLAGLGFAARREQSRAAPTADDSKFRLTE
jgi:hypothetical protein